MLTTTAALGFGIGGRFAMLKINAGTGQTHGQFGADQQSLASFLRFGFKVSHTLDLEVAMWKLKLAIQIRI